MVIEYRMFWSMYKRKRISCSVFFFFQAEDGIRDLVRSRGLGDVYKRQRFISNHSSGKMGFAVAEAAAARGAKVTVIAGATTVEPVSYTHLTLPTSDLV